MASEVSAAVVLEGLARKAWARSHSGDADCPASAIPTAEGLLDWLAEQTSETLAGFGERMAMLIRFGLADTAPPDVWVSLCDANWQAHRQAHRETPESLIRSAGAEIIRRHPLAPVIEAWQARITERLPDATVTTASGLVRRPRSVSRALQASWERVGIDVAEVDGEPFATVSPNAVAAFGKPRRRAYKRGDQRALGLRGFGELPGDLRLIAVAALDEAGPILSGDTLALMQVAQASDRPITVSASELAMLLARSRDGGFRRVRDSDLKRAHFATQALHWLILNDPKGSGRWINLARVEPLADDRYILGPPAWMREASRDQWTLTAEGGWHGRMRIASGEGATMGRVITGLEHFIAAHYLGGRGLNPNLQPANGKGSAGPAVSLPWRTVQRLAGFTWDESDSRADHAARVRHDRIVRGLRRNGYLLPTRNGRPNLRGEAEAGDSVEIVRIVRGARGRLAGLEIRASARFVAAARLSIRAEGQGFERVSLPDWMGLPVPVE